MASSTDRDATINRLRNERDDIGRDMRGARRKADRAMATIRAIQESDPRWERHSFRSYMLDAAEQQNAHLALRLRWRALRVAIIDASRGV